MDRGSMFSGRGILHGTVGIALAKKQALGREFITTDFQRQTFPPPLLPGAHCSLIKWKCLVTESFISYKAQAPEARETVGAAPPHPGASSSQLRGAA